MPWIGDNCARRAGGDVELTVRLRDFAGCGPHGRCRPGCIGVGEPGWLASDCYDNSRSSHLQRSLGRSFYLGAGNLLARERYENSCIGPATGLAHMADLGVEGSLFHVEHFGTQPKLGDVPRGTHFHQAQNGLNPKSEGRRIIPRYSPSNTAVFHRFNKSRGSNLESRTASANPFP